VVPANACQEEFYSLWTAWGQSLYNSLGMNECCFVWGVPLSGQRYWMNRAAEETEDAVVTMLPLENQNPQPSVAEVLGSLEKSLLEAARSPLKTPYHIYCELPWEITEDATDIEEWLASRSELFGGDKPDWNLSFVCVCPADADRLPARHRSGLEDFARASQSAVIVVRREGDESELTWFEDGMLDFGRTVEVFEEHLWPPAADSERVFARPVFQVDDFQAVTLPVSGDRVSYTDLFQDLAQGYYGPLWGAEAIWKNSQGQLEALTLSQGKIFTWTSDEASLIKDVPVNGASLSLVGVSLRTQDLMLTLRTQSFC
jgi:hypothetical protein